MRRRHFAMLFYGEWVGTLFGAGPGKLPVHHTLTREGGLAHAWNAYGLDAQVRMPCRVCNSGWMSDLRSEGPAHHYAHDDYPDGRETALRCS